MPYGHVPPIRPLQSSISESREEQALRIGELVISLFELIGQLKTPISPQSAGLHLVADASENDFGRK